MMMHGTVNVKITGVGQFVKGHTNAKSFWNRGEKVEIQGNVPRLGNL
jgi:hypothetical protein